MRKLPNRPLQRTGLGVKVEGQNEMYFWNNENYKQGARILLDEDKLEHQRYHVRIAVEFEGEENELPNGGPSLTDVRVRRLPT